MHHVIIFILSPIAFLGMLAGIGTLYAVEYFARQQRSIIDFLGPLAILVLSLVTWAALYRWVSRKSSNTAFLGFDRTGWQVMVVLAYLAGIAVAVMIRYLE